MVTLASSDNGEVYIERYHLMANRYASVPPLWSYLTAVTSWFFRDLFGCSQIGDKDDKRIVIDLPYTELLMFTTSFCKAGYLSELGRDALDTLLSICDKYDCPHLTERIGFRLHELVSDAPWEVFGIASRYDMLSLAKAAIRAMDGDPRERKDALSLHRISAADAAMVTLPYLLGFHKAAKQADCEANVHGSASSSVPNRPWRSDNRSVGVAAKENRLPKNWNAMAKGFQPVC
ncbi:hypothetical protein P7C73_g6750, partial [Tremellales sp. Uapishka_1]